MERIAADRARPAAVRKVAEDELAHIRDGGGVDPSWQRVQATITFESQIHSENLEDDVTDEAHAVLLAARADRARRIKENRAKRASAAANAVRSLRSFSLLWAELRGWSKHYVPERVAREMSDDDWELFLERRRGDQRVHRGPHAGAIAAPLRRRDGWEMSRMTVPRARS